MVNINIEVPEDLHRQLKLAAVLTGQTLKGYVIAALDTPAEKGPAEGR